MKQDTLKMKRWLNLILLIPTLVHGNGFYDFLDQLDDRISWSLGAELLIFKPNLENLTYGDGFTFQNFNITPTTDPVPANDLYSGTAWQERKRVLFQYDPGFRLRLGAQFCEYDLDAALIWTQLHSRAKDSSQERMLNLNNGSFIKPPSGILKIGNPIGEAVLSVENPISSGSGSYSLDFEQLDFLFSKKLSLYKNILLEPACGLAAIKIKQKFLVSSLQINRSLIEPLLFGTFTNQLFHDEAIRYQGIGGKAGFTSHWIICREFSLIGSFFGAAYWGEFDLKQQALEVSFLSGPDGSADINAYAGHISLNNHHRFQDIKFVSSLTLGFEYSFEFNCGCNSGLIRASWEGHWLPSQNLFSEYLSTGAINTISTTSPFDGIRNAGKSTLIGGDLSMNGWVISLILDF